MEKKSTNIESELTPFYEFQKLCCLSVSVCYCICSLESGFETVAKILLVLTLLILSKCLNLTLTSSSNGVLLAS